MCGRFWCPPLSRGQVWGRPLPTRRLDSRGPRRFGGDIPRDARRETWPLLRHIKLEVEKYKSGSFSRSSLIYFYILHSTRSPLNQCAVQCGENCWQLPPPPLSSPFSSELKSHNSEHVCQRYGAIMLGGRRPQAHPCNTHCRRRSHRHQHRRQPRMCTLQLR